MAEPANPIGTSNSGQPSFTTVPEVLLRLNKCLIRRHHSSDAQAIAREGNNPNVAKGMSNSWPQPYTPEDAHSWMALTNSGSPPHGFVICQLEDNVAIGGIGIPEKEEGDSSTMLIGYWVGQDHWGQGIATEVVTSMTQWCFDNFGGLQRMEAEVNGGNDASCRVLEKAGFVFQDRKKNAVRKGGIDMDVLVYYKTRPSSLSK